jgi:hypothetical protein
MELKPTHESVPGGFFVHDLDLPLELVTARSVDFNNISILLSSINSESSGLTKY